ncbi:hypothetical protein GGH18_001763 [Coemansia sp. RSA 530]|nr:hypothetical protein GGH18_001763 [Coemansia sp. RSA 530]
MAEQKPIHYFVCSDSSDSLNLDNSTESNTIVEYFDSEEDVDLAKLADIVKSKPYCVQKHFIVYNGTEYCAVETDNVENTYIFSLKHRSSIVPKLTAGTATIDAFIEYDKHMEDMAKKLETQPGFKLRDSNGKVIPDGKEFAIQILSDPEDELDEDTEGVSEEMLLFHNKYWICNYVDYGDGRVNIFCGQPHEGDTFECETINNIVYLKHDGEYLFFDADDKRSLLYFSDKVPTKEQRIQIHFDDNGDIWFTNWDGSTSVTCEEVKYSYSMIGLCENNIPTKFRLVSL